MTHYNYIGIGHNPNGLDLPVGLGMLLAQEPEAMNNFGNLSDGQKNELVRYIQNARTGEESEFRVKDTVEKLRTNNLSQLMGDVHNK